MKRKLIGKFTTTDFVDLGSVYPVGIAFYKGNKPKVIKYSLDNVRYFEEIIESDDNQINFSNLIARYIKFDCELELEIYEGEGYIGSYNDEWTDLFVQDQYWVGGDGLFSFNLTGSDDYSSSEDDVTVCVFGDTFACTLGIDESRLSPLAMPNNSYSVLHSTNPTKANVEFFINEDEKGHCIAYLLPNNDLAYVGTMASNLVDYNSNNIGNYLSGVNPKKNIEITFDLYEKHYVKFLRIFNYFIESEIDLNYQNRGINHLNIYLDNKFYKEITLDKAIFELKGSNYNDIVINQNVKEIKFVISNVINIGNFGGVNGKEAFFGLNKIYIHENDDRYYQYIAVDATSEFLKGSKHSWFWLQDGVIIDKKFYSLPYVVSSDESQPEGFKFKIEGINLIECDVKDNYIDFINNKQTITNLYKQSKDITRNFGCGILDNSKEDGYIYIYGYTKEFLDFEHGNRLIVARVSKEKFKNINNWEFFNGTTFVKEMESAAPILDHMSCEMSVHKDNGKYVAVFTYDVQSRYIAYATSDTPYGPFEKTRIAYVCKEDLCPHMYLYNAKAHPHLSKEGNILASYNINTSDFDENIKFGRTYGPRFINLAKTGGGKYE